MQTNLYTITIPVMAKHLKAMSKILDKMQDHTKGKHSDRFPSSLHEETILNDRLYFDMFPLKRQIQIMSDQAKGCAARLAEVENPKFDDTEKTVADLKERIDKTVAFIESFKPEQIAEKENVKVILPYFPDKHMTGFGYVTEYLLPNFFFHAATAYAILRKNGVDVGKADFMGGLPLRD